MSQPERKPKIESASLNQALLRSERLRTLAVMTFVIVFVGVMAIRIFVYGSAMSRWGLLASLLLVAYEFAVLRTINQALKQAKELPVSVWFCSIVLETSFPAVGIALFASSRLEAAYRPLATPWVLAFFPFIMLSTLRLSPVTARLTGSIATASYLAAAYYHGWRLSLENLKAHSVTQTAVGFYALILLASGFIAGVVAAEIRKHVQAALREAETRHKLEQVEHDLGIARTIQQSLLPRIRPKISGFEIAGWNLPADETGGDYFDWQHMSDGRLAVMLADVTGHGIGPAMLASECRAYARASFRNHDNLPGTLQRINQSLEDDLAPDRFATFAAVICTDGNDRVELLSAGHGPLFVYCAATQTLQKFGAQSVPFGIVPLMEFEAPLTLHLRPGDLVLLITDGFFEWENAAGEQFGLGRLGDSVRKSNHLAPEEIIAELYNAVLVFTNGSKQTDDLTAVVIKRVRSSSGVAQDAVSALAIS
jgi:serine phosphatase RsbU (regulator of sigma subunit)